MLEGQVAVLSSGYLSAEQSLDVMDALRNSAIYREDQNSYILYPNKELKGFLQRNQIPAEWVQKSDLLKALTADNNVLIIEADLNGVYHFHGSIRNRFELDNALNKLDQNKYGELIEQERDLVQSIYEKVFNHKTFTGRSGTFYGYEGLGSIYWHMVSKLLLAVEETTIAAFKNNTSTEITNALKTHCAEVFEGIGVHKSPSVYGAFSIDPYSHTPFTKGAQQPGMTGQVKEDIISRFVELGVEVNAGKISFAPTLLSTSEFISAPTTFEYYDVNGNSKAIDIESNALAFTYCQVPIIYNLAEKNELTVYFIDGEMEEFDTNVLPEAFSELIFKRTGKIERIEVGLGY